jgi:hypothetical protein
MDYKMNLSMNETKIKKLCGVTSFKKAKAYSQAEKVILRSFKKAVQ